MNEKKPLVAFAYYGGKASHLKWLLPLLPQTDYYCEPFGGSAAVLLNRPPSKIETYNDLESEVVNFFRVLRENPDELVRLITYTPYSREEFVNALKWEGCTELERARKFYIRIRQSYGAKAGELGHWSHSYRGETKTIRSFVNSKKVLHQVAQRLLNVQLEHSSATYVVKSFDHRKTLFYVDPPYDGEVCSPDYKFKLDKDGYKALVPVLEKLEGKVAVSGYNSELCRGLFKSWNKVEIPTRTAVNNTPLSLSLFQN